MDLYRACQVAGTPVRLPGVSNRALVERIREAPNYKNDGKDLTPAVSLEDGVRLRPFEALHWLSYATRPRYQDDLLDRYMHWALARYVGLFEHVLDGSSVPALMLSEAGRRIRGNQRRVTSEEMGIGFGALLASIWFMNTGAQGLPVSIVDVDVALDDRYVFAGGSRHAVRSIKDRRPDYLLIAPDPSSQRLYRVRALECKGTRSTVSYAVRQLASATEQLTGITVAGRIPKGLAVSTVTADDRISYLAIDPAEGEEPSYPVNSNTIDQAAGFQLQDNVRDVEPEMLANASVRASWATLADFSGNMPAFQRWAPAVMQRRLARQPRQRTTLDTPYGTARGTSTTLGTEGSRLHITYAVETTIDRQLAGNPEAITDAQIAFSNRLAQVADPSRGLSAAVSGLPDTLYSATSDGSIFTVRIE